MIVAWTQSVQHGRRRITRNGPSLARRSVLAATLAVGGCGGRSDLVDYANATELTGADASLARGDGAMADGPRGDDSSGSSDATTSADAIDAPDSTSPIDGPTPADSTVPIDATEQPDSGPSGGPDSSTKPPSDASEDSPIGHPDASCDGCWQGSTCVGAIDTSVTACGIYGVECRVCTGPNASCGKGACFFTDEGCSASNCAGCCVDQNICSDGLSVGDCGYGGHACQGCGTIQSTLPCIPQPSGGGQCQPTCNSSNCHGCCDGNTCLLGQTDSACGTQGGACTACPMGQACNEINGIAGGACQIPCSPASCMGCCESNVCAVGNQAIACGTGGAACTDCTASFQECSSGACAP